MRSMRITCVLAALAIGGCGLFVKKSTGPLIGDIRSPISDVPVPVGFSMQESSQSKLVPAESRREVDHRYKGYENMLPVVSFYKDELPKHNWVWIDQTQITGKEVILHFVKKNEDLLINVRQATTSTEIRVRIGKAGN